MSITIKDYLNSAKFVRDNILDESERIVYANEKEIVKLNIVSIENHEDNNGGLLENSNRKMFKGVYSLATQLINPNKIAGTPYDFFETGAFLGNFELQVSTDLTKFNIFSTGTGSGEKKAFFDGYKNLYGLNPDDQRKVNYEIIQPELLKFIKKYL